MRKCVALVLSMAAFSNIGTVSAQSSIIIFAVVDNSVSGYRNQAKGLVGPSVTTGQTVLTNSALTPSRFGFRGREDLGGGLGASFWLEAGVNSDDGSGAGPNDLIQFNRRSTVSIDDGDWGELRLGRDYTPTYWNDNLFDPFGVNGVGTSLISTASRQTPPGSFKSGWSNGQYSRASNSIGYHLPQLGGFYGQVMYAFNEKITYDSGGTTPPGLAAIAANPALAATADDARAGRYVGARGGYRNGPVDIALAYGESTVGSNYYAGSTTIIKIWNVAGSYNFGAVKLFGEYSNNKIDTSHATNAFNPSGVTRPQFDGVLIGAIVPIGVGDLKAAYSAVRYKNVNSDTFGLNPDPKADKIALGYVHNFSKRTAVYATIAYLDNKHGAGLTVGGPNYYTQPIAGVAPAPDKSYGYDLGMRVSF